jgi:ParB-like chromosome segregation protein Spo0J
MKQVNLLSDSLKKVSKEVDGICKKADILFSELSNLKEHEKVKAINQIRLSLHKYSPFSKEPVDCVQWVYGEEVIANDYNPNNVAPPEMELLERSIMEDGYTQPIVAWKRVEDGHFCFEVVDGFHRNRVGKESKKVSKRIKGYLPLSIINSDREERGNRIAATIRHNRARGKHRIDGMSDIVMELKRRNWSDGKISRNLGMDTDEILRLYQIGGLAEMFVDKEFSEAWEVSTNILNEKDNLDIENE